MQTKFAVVEYRNHELAINARIAFAWLAGKWAAVRMREMTVMSLAARTVSSAREPRMAQWTPDVRHLGAYNATDDAAALTEISMLARRYLYLPGRALSYDEPFDWVQVTEQPQIMTFKEAYTQPSQERNLPAAVAQLVRRLWAGPAAVYTDRVNAVLMRAAGISDTPTRGIHWRGAFFGDYEEAYTDRVGAYKKLGGLLARVIGYYNDPNYDSEVADEQRAHVASEAVYLTSTGLFSTTQAARFASVAQRKGDVLISNCDCGHLACMDERQQVVSGGTQVMWCPACAEHDSVTVVDLAQRWARDDAYYSDSRGEYYSYDVDAADEDNDEETESPSRATQIMAYTTNVLRVLKADRTIKSSHYGDFLMGIELEMTSGSGSRALAARDVISQLGSDYCIAKNDGSLDDNGFEVVTAPRGLAEHIKRFTEWQIDSAYRAWDAGNCGLHVHLHSRAFTELTLGKFLIFINANENADFIRKIAGRHPYKDEQASRYCAQEGQTLMLNPKWAVKGKSHERYRMVNTQNLSIDEAQRLGIPARNLTGRYDTVELRIFRASLKKERLLAQIEFAHAVVMFCRVASYRDLTGTSFVKWLVSSCKLYPNLANWYGVRKSKAIKDAGGKALQDVCGDKVLGTVTAPRAPRPVVSLSAAQAAVRALTGARP